MNSSLIEAEIIRGDIEVVHVPANRIADELGNPKAANMVMLGAFVRKSGVVELGSVLKALRHTLGSKKKLVDINERAVRTGFELY